MSRTVYRFHIHEEIELEEVEGELAQAIFCVENLYGEARTRLEAGYFLDREQRTLVVDASSEVGQSLCRLLAGSLAREYPPDGFTVRRMDKQPAQAASAGGNHGD